MSVVSMVVSCGDISSNRTPKLSGANIIIDADDSRTVSIAGEYSDVTIKSDARIKTLTIEGKGHTITVEKSAKINEIILLGDHNVVYYCKGETPNIKDQGNTNRFISYL